MKVTCAYELASSPPCPFADVSIVNPLTGNATNILPGKIVTGADLTIVPELFLAPLNVIPARSGWLTGFDGSRSYLPLYYLGIAIEGFTFPAVLCYSMNRRNVLLGRNILNQFLMTLDGRKHTLTLER